jgi:hypothetical protein
MVHIGVRLAIDGFGTGLAPIASFTPERGQRRGGHQLAERDTARKTRGSWGKIPPT